MSKLVSNFNKFHGLLVKFWTHLPPRSYPAQGEKLHTFGENFDFFTLFGKSNFCHKKLPPLKPAVPHFCKRFTCKNVTCKRHTCKILTYKKPYL